MVHSDRYWRSPYCIFELWTVMEELRLNRGRDLMSVVIPVEHLNRGITYWEQFDDYRKEWLAFCRTPRMLGWDPQTLKDNAVAVLRSFDPDRIRSFNIRWTGNGEAALAAIADRLSATGGK